MPLRTNQPQQEDACELRDVTRVIPRFRPIVRTMRCPERVGSHEVFPPDYRPGATGRTPELSGPTIMGSPSSLPAND